jgi:heme iron utilization protein
MSQFEAIEAAYQVFTEQFQSIIISTVNQNGIPNASYAPFVIDDNKSIYIFVSGLSTHTQNLQVVPKASVLFIDDESNTQQIFARRRLNYECNASLLPRDTQSWIQVISNFEARFGNIIQLMRDLPDFRIFKLVPFGGRFVVGFGAAYEIDASDLTRLIHLTGKEN